MLGQVRGLKQVSCVASLVLAQFSLGNTVLLPKAQAAEILCTVSIPKAPREDLCLRASISGRIEAGDAEMVGSFLETNRELLGLELLSPGGNVTEAIDIGRQIRARLLPVTALPMSSHQLGSTYSCGVDGRLPCCISACAIIYFGGAQWFSEDILGLHRPTVEYLGDLAYDDVLSASNSASEDIRAYLGEMGVDDRIFELMMSAGPEEIIAWKVNNYSPSDADDLYRYPPTLRDWLFDRCRRMGDRSRYDCIAEELALETRRRAAVGYEPDEVESQIEEMGIAELKRYLNAAEKPPLFYRLLAEERLSELRMLGDREAIDAMGLCEVKVYIDGRFGDDGKLAPGERLTMKRAMDRLEAVTGDPEPWGETNRDPLGCPDYVSRF